MALSDCPTPGYIAPEVQQGAVKEATKLKPDSDILTVLTVALDDRDKLRACNSIKTLRAEYREE